MPDICLCANGSKCKKKDTCYRYQATPDMFQTVADFYTFEEECKYYWEMKEDARQVQDNDKEL